MATALVVSDCDELRHDLSEELRSRGMEAYTCPGPRPPAYICPAGLGAICPLAAGADVIVLDLDLEGDPAELLDYYGSLRVPVVALTGAEPVDASLLPAVTLPRNADVRTIADAAASAGTDARTPAPG